MIYFSVVNDFLFGEAGDSAESEQTLLGVYEAAICDILGKVFELLQENVALFLIVDI
jgi:hypothetical protein